MQLLPKWAHSKSAVKDKKYLQTMSLLIQGMKKISRKKRIKATRKELKEQQKNSLAHLKNRLFLPQLQLSRNLSVIMPGTQNQRNNQMKCTQEWKVNLQKYILRPESSNSIRTIIIILLDTKRAQELMIRKMNAVQVYLHAGMRVDSILLSLLTLLRKKEQ